MIEVLYIATNSCYIYVCFIQFPYVSQGSLEFKQLACIQLLGYKLIEIGVSFECILTTNIVLWHAYVY